MDNHHQHCISWNKLSLQVRFNVDVFFVEAILLVNMRDEQDSILSFPIQESVPIQSLVVNNSELIH
jgi:hypothetical protein